MKSVLEFLFDRTQQATGGHRHCRRRWLMSAFSPASLGLSWADSADSASALPPAAPGPSGKQISGHGGGSTAGLPSGNRVGIVAVAKSDFGSAWCGGVVGGAGKKMCVRKDCSIGAHQASKGKVDIEHFFLGNEGGVPWPVEELCFIVATTDPLGNPVVVHVSPTLPKAFLPASEADEYLQRRQTTDAWTMIFESLQAVHAEALEESKAVEDSEVVFEKIQKATDSAAYYVTPKKRKGRGLEKSPSSDFEMPIKELPDLEFLDHDEALQAVITSWGDLRYNLDFLASVTGNAQERSRARDNDLEDQLDELEIKVVGLRTLLGNREEILGLGTESICKGLHGLFELVEKLRANFDGLDEWQNEVANTVTTQLTTAIEEGIKNQVFSGDYHEKWILPLCRFLQANSSSHTAPGDRLLQQMHDVETHLATLEAKLPSSGGSGGVPASGAWPTWSGTPGGGYPAVPPVAPRPVPPPSSTSNLSILSEQMTTLLAEVQQLKAQQEAESVSVGGVLFKSLDHATTWLAGSGAEHFIYLFVDPMSLLSMSDTVKRDESESTLARAATARISDPNPEYTQYVASFALEVPPIFGKTSDPNTTSSSKALAAIPNYDAWDTGLGIDGVKHRLADVIADGYTRLMTDITLNLPTEAGLVAKELAVNAKLFWGENSSFMSTFTTELINRSEASSSECWNLTSHCERAVFKLLRDSRKVGQRRVPGQMLWGTLQANRVAQELLACKFQGHPNISIILHQHLIDHSVPISKFTALHSEVVSLRKELAAVKQTADKALSTANNSKKQEKK